MQPLTSFICWLLAGMSHHIESCGILNVSTIIGISLQTLDQFQILSLTCREHVSNMA